LKLLKIKKISGQIKLLSGLHIGAGKDSIEIGGTDSPVMKNPFNGEPYIPGSSLKGKMRSMLEWRMHKVGNGDVIHSPNHLDAISIIFGHTNRNLKSGPTRLVVRDSNISKETIDYLRDRSLLSTEVKSENTINRITSEAMPRQMERAIPGLKFDLEITFKIFDSNGTLKDDKNQPINDEHYFDFVLQTLALVQLDCLGGGGSRGNGKVEFINLKDEEGKEVKLPEISFKQSQ
jgi:CRISPR-associated protein Csm3